MRAIPTSYRGTQFRSRLEADWAATLDHRGIGWRYEPEGFALSDGTWYSPDFWLPACRVWLEVKGSHMQRLHSVEQFAADLWDEWEAAQIELIDAGRDPESLWLHTGARYADSPMVVLGLDPHPSDPITGWPERLNYLGVRGHGKRYSVKISRCTACEQVAFGTFPTDWGTQCRICRGQDERETGDPESWTDYSSRPFVRLERPAGRTR